MNALNVGRSRSRTTDSVSFLGRTAQGNVTAMDQIASTDEMKFEDKFVLWPSIVVVAIIVATIFILAIPGVFIWFAILFTLFSFAGIGAYLLLTLVPIILAVQATFRYQWRRAISLLVLATNAGFGVPRHS
jgi:hypothetical protein